MLVEALLGIGTKLLDKLIPDPAQKAEAQIKLAEMAQNGELEKLAKENEAYKTEQDNVTGRWSADMASDSWLSKNIRPMALVAILTGYFGFALMSAWNFNVNNAYVELLGQGGMLVMSAYFGGRTLEKIIELKNKK